MITGILHATFLTTDLTQSRAFYEGVLGLQLNLDRPTMNYDGVWYDVADKQQIHLMLSPPFVENSTSSSATTRVEEGCT